MLANNDANNEQSMTDFAIVATFAHKNLPSQKMSWQAYVDTNLVGTKKILKAAIYGHDGSLWATSQGFNVR